MPGRWFPLSHTTFQKGYLVGNPITGDDIDKNSRIPAAHSFGVISDQLYEAVTKNCEGDYVSPRNRLCANLLQTSDDLISEVSIDNVLDKVCQNDALKRKSLLEESFGLSGTPNEPPFGCYKYTRYLSYFWANNNATKAALGIKEGTLTEWTTCKRYAGLPYSYDLRNSMQYHFNLTTRGYRVLVYSGDHDLTVPFCGTQAWIRSFNFPITDDWRAWHLQGQAAGFTITYVNNLTYATVKGGRHIAPENRPEECFAMASRWLDNKPL
ncbi:hypothetical protein QOZ80_3AG0217660 [Eleusine coracana subsp. coracana]|nr:hypothetical protein QOZ80_3AG0217660 [Eleusine coracana subsp. coracana]